MKTIALSAAALALSLSGGLAAPAFADGCSYSAARTVTAEPVRYVSHGAEGADIVDTAAAAGSFSTLLAAAEAADLVDALKGDGPLTVFAPTDAAFAALPEGTVETLLKPENKHQLADILKLHVIAGQKITSDQLAGAVVEATTLGGTVTVDGTNGVKVDQANVITADVNAANGIIHVIDAVLLPSS